MIYHRFVVTFKKAFHDYSEFLQLLYDILMGLEGRVNINIRNDLGETPLQCAVHRSDLANVLAFLSNNADVNIADNDGNTPLHIAAEVRSKVLNSQVLCVTAADEYKMITYVLSWIPGWPIFTSSAITHLNL